MDMLWCVVQLLLLENRVAESAGDPMSYSLSAQTATGELVRQMAGGEAPSNPD